ncbi:MAG: hypothetical protein EA356_13685 [Geminicoccaceae bacterium]|nr:MAG: hypothetical protein EA356_13685 [Geminicoccaceae bacterium]
MRAWAFWVALVVGVWALTPAFADERPRVGQLAALQGTVALAGPLERRGLTGGEVLRAGDRLVTGAGSRALVQLEGGLTVVVGAASELVVQRAAREGGPWSTLVELATGVVRAVLSAPTAGAEVQIQTTFAVTSVRSTEWTVEQSAEGTAVFAQSGSVAVDAAGEQVVLAAGQGTDIAPGAAPTPPIAWGAPRVADTLERTAFRVR